MSFNGSQYLRKLDYIKIKQLMNFELNKTCDWCSIEFAEDRVQLWMSRRLGANEGNIPMEFVNKKLKFWTEVLAQLQQKDKP